MILSTQAHVPDSALCRFLDRHLPGRQGIVDDWKAALRSAPGSAPYLRGDRETIGEAFELRIGLDLADNVRDVPVLEFLPQDEYRLVVEASGFARKDSVRDPETTDPLLWNWHRTHRPERVDHRERSVLSSCLAMTSVSAFARSRGRPSVEAKRYVMRSMGIRHDDASTLTGAMAQAWDSYLQHGRERLLARRGQKVGNDKVGVAPVLADGFATADLIVGRTLLDVKVWYDPAPYLAKALNQVLGYLLLDRLDRHRLDAIGVYLGWQAVLLAADITQVLGCASPGAAPSLDELRDQFRHDLQDDLDQAALTVLGP